MRIAYCTDVRLPSERAHGHQIAQVCDALVRLGHAVTVFAPHRRNPVKASYHEYYRAEAAVKLEHLGSFDPIDHRLLPRCLQLPVLHRSLRREYPSALRAGRFDLAYTRSPALIRTLTASGIPTVLELHQIPRRHHLGFIGACNRCARVLCLTSAMRDELRRRGVREEILAVEGDAVDLRRFTPAPDATEGRRLLGIRTDRLVVGYVGRLKTLGMEKGVSHILQALARLKHERAFFGCIVGGPDGDRREYEQLATSLGLGAEDVAFPGEIPAHDVPQALAACDILAMPFPDLPHYRTHMSPLKMFEYMAAGRPIVTSDLPTVRDVLSEETAVFCAPGEVESLAGALAWIRANPDTAAARAAAARTLVTYHTWEERMKRALHGLPHSA